MIITFYVINSHYIHTSNINECSIDKVCIIIPQVRKKSAENRSTCKKTTINLVKLYSVFFMFSVKASLLPFN